MDEDADEMMAGLRMLFLLHQQRKRQLKRGGAKQKKPPPVGDERIPRLPPSLTEQHRYFAQISSNRNPRVFRENFCMHRADFDRLYDLCEPYIDDGTRSKRELLGVTIHWLATACVARQQETKFQIEYSTCREYRVAGIAALTEALAHLVQLPTQVPMEFAQRFPYFSQALRAIVGTHVEVTVAAADANQFAVGKRQSRPTYSSSATVISTSATCTPAPKEALTIHTCWPSVDSWATFLPTIMCSQTQGSASLDPYRGVRYHLREWSNEYRRRPKNPRELYNLRHSTTRNVVERAIGVCDELSS